MKTNFKSILLIGAGVIFTLLSACHFDHKDSTSIADSANKKQIAATDSANRANSTYSDSVNRANTLLKESASKFLVKSFESGMFEIQMARLVALKGLNADVKDLELNLLGSYNSITAKITEIATTAGFTLPAAIHADHQKDLNDLDKLAGADFDNKYVALVVADHKAAVNDYKDAYKNLPESLTKTFASETLPKIEDLFALAKKVKERIK